MPVLPKAYVMSAEDTTPEQEPEAVEAESAEDRVVKGLCNIGRTADGLKQSFLTIDIRGFGLDTVEPISKYQHLQCLKLAQNSITTLKGLGNLNYVTMDVWFSEFGEPNTDGSAQLDKTFSIDNTDCSVDAYVFDLNVQVGGLQPHFQA